MVSIENTTNKGGGACYDLRELKKINKICNKYGFPIHLDGARLWNAMIATNSKPSDYGKYLTQYQFALVRVWVHQWGLHSFVQKKL